MEQLKATERTQFGRKPQRGSYDLNTICEIIDQAMICHVGFREGDAVCVIPTILARMGKQIFIHGAMASRMMQKLAAGESACITVTHVDGIVLARSAFAHSMNYRSAVIFGQGRVIDDLDEKRKALKAISDQLVPGRWEEVREPTLNEMNVTQVVAFELSEASAKMRQGPPTDLEPDYALPVWAGVLPVKTTFGEPEADPKNLPGLQVPSYLDLKNK